MPKQIPSILVASVKVFYDSKEDRNEDNTFMHTVRNIKMNYPKCFICNRYQNWNEHLDIQIFLPGRILSQTFYSTEITFFPFSRGVKHKHTDETK